MTAMQSWQVRPEVDFLLKSGRMALYVACFLVPLTSVRSFGSLMLSDVALLAALCIGLLSIVRTKIHIPGGMLIAASFAVLGCLFTAAQVGDLGSQASVAVRMVFVLAMWPLAAVRLILTRQHIIRSAYAFALGCSLSALVAIGQFMGTDLRPIFLATSVEDATARFIGLNGHPNGQAGTLAIAFTFAIAGILHGVNRKIGIIVAILCLAGIVLSASITGLIAAGVGFTVTLLRARKVRALFLGAVLLASAYGGLTVVRSALPSLVTPLDRISSATGETGISTVGIRLQTVDTAWSAIKSAPWSGMGFAADAGSTNGDGTQVHNMELLAWYQGGPLLFAAVVIAALIALRAGWRRGESIQEVLFSGVFVALFFAQTGPSLYDRYVWVPVALLLAARAIARERSSFPEPQHESQSALNVRNDRVRARPWQERSRHRV